MASVQQALHIAIASELSERIPQRRRRMSVNPYLTTDISVLLAATKSKYPLLGTARIDNYVEETVPRYSDPLFKAHFRMCRSSFQELLELLGPLTEVKTISLERRMLACLWYVSNQETFRSVVDRFGLSKGSLHYFLNNFCRTMTSVDILPHHISWPTPREYDTNAHGFADKTGFPGVLGAIDGTYIPIPGPSDFRDSYICRKGFPAMHLQGVCDSALRFVDVYCAFPGSVHDSRVFKNSPIWNYVQDLPQQYHILGDSAYSLSATVLVPFRDNGHLSQQEKSFNYKHSSTRVSVEHAFGLLKGKFRKLKYLDMRNVKDIPLVIVTCCVLHNFIINRESYDMDEIEVDQAAECCGPEGQVVESTNGISKRLEIMHKLS